MGGIGARIVPFKQLQRALSTGTNMPKTVRTHTVLVDSRLRNMGKHGEKENLSLTGKTQATSQTMAGTHDSVTFAKFCSFSGWTFAPIHFPPKDSSSLSKECKDEDIPSICKVPLDSSTSLDIFYYI